MNPNWKGRNKTVTFSDDMILYIFLKVNLLNGRNNIQNIQIAHTT